MSFFLLVVCAQCDLREGWMGVSAAAGTDMLELDSEKRCPRGPPLYMTYVVIAIVNAMLC